MQLSAVISRAAFAFAFFSTIMLFTSRQAPAQTEKVIYDFCSKTNCSDGTTPNSGLIMDKKGNLYGTVPIGGVNTCSGESDSCGAVFKLSLSAGKWKETILYSFGANATDGNVPQAGLIMDSKGNLYGTTEGGGTQEGCISGCGGTVFELTPKPSGGCPSDTNSGTGWCEKILYNFCSVKNCSDGSDPEAGLIVDSAGNLYGTTAVGGKYLKYGTVFELSPTEEGTWTEKVLHNFSNAGGDGAAPIAGLVMDAKGSLYGMTPVGGKNKYGIVFELASGTWKETILHSFPASATDGQLPTDGLIIDTAGNLYGTTGVGGSNGGGTAFELTPDAKGKWTESAIYDFGDPGATKDGSVPYAGLFMDATGNLYGTTQVGGQYTDYGAVFELTPSAGGVWTERILHSFDFNGTDGYQPQSGVIMDTKGNLYGTTYFGGTGTTCGGGCGTVFEVTP